MSAAGAVATDAAPKAAEGSPQPDAAASGAATTATVAAAAAAPPAELPSTAAEPAVEGRSWPWWRSGEVRHMHSSGPGQAYHHGRCVFVGHRTRLLQGCTPDTPTSIIKQHRKPNHAPHSQQLLLSSTCWCMPLNNAHSSQTPCSWLIDTVWSTACLSDVDTHLWYCVLSAQAPSTPATPSSRVKGLRDALGDGFRSLGDTIKAVGDAVVAPGARSRLAAAAEQAGTEQT